MLPPIDWVGHLVGYLFEVGPLTPIGMDSAPISHTEIAAWCALTGMQLAPWEVRFLRRMSCDYLAKMRAAEDPDCPEPWPQGSPDARAGTRAFREAMRARRSN